jgi:hypothetical protein
MLFFTIPKPFRGHTGTIQRNAVGSWLRTAPGARALLVADEEGTAEAAADAGAEHAPRVASNEWGTPLLSDAFRLAGERAAGGEPLVFVNADIVLFADVADAARRVAARRRPFLVVGESWNVRLAEPLAFEPGWETRVRALPARRRGADALDWFVFTLVVDATAAVRALHQDHDYAHGGSLGRIRTSPEAARNRELAGGKSRLYSRFDATHRLTRVGLVPNPGRPLRWQERSRRALAKARYLVRPAEE